MTIILLDAIENVKALVEALDTQQEGYQTANQADLDQLLTDVAENQTDLNSIITTLAGMGSGLDAKTSIFTSSGSWTRPHSGVGMVWALVVGGGGGGYHGYASAGGCGGGGGEVLYRPIPVTGNLTVTVGAGGYMGNGGNSSLADGYRTYLANGGKYKAAYCNASNADRAEGGDAYANARADYPERIHGGAGIYPGGGGGKSATTESYRAAPQDCPGWGNAGSSIHNFDGYGGAGGGSFNDGADELTGMNQQGTTPSGYGGGASGSCKGSGDSLAYSTGAPGLVILQWFE